MTDEQFFERLRRDAAALRHEPDAFALTRIRARIRESIREGSGRPTVAQLLANWFRPLAMTLTAIAVAAAIGFTTLGTSDSSAEPGVEVVMAGETYSVGQ
jgi:hypothetical protein